ncbi:hypothetical protein PTTW11_00787 [Pyrenophora teres f. teres]|uniref:Uncharacterized protein n=1 Tax=Pyrenophora teres f. teres TaxID=97479 RepID=A0A6S6VCW9_9PLEO|nr:hypothetical protein PTTW11_00787 [Pyrenophora teres f. teres]
MQDMYSTVAPLDGSSQHAPAHEAPPDAASHLLRLPNELLLLIAGYAAPTPVVLEVTYPGYVKPAFSVNEDQGFGHEYKCNPKWRASHSQEVRDEYASRANGLVNLSLVCKALTPVAQHILYRDVSLLQPRRVCSSDKPTLPSALACFLRTMLQRPWLALRVRSLCVWIWEDKAISLPSDVDVRALTALIYSIDVSVVEKEAWSRALDSPFEATVCGLVFAALPRLEAVELYSHKSPHPGSEDRDNEQSCLQVPRLAMGLSMTHITSLTVSTRLNGLDAARLPSLKTLAVNFDGFNVFDRVDQGSFVNVETLKIRHTPCSHWPDEALCEELSKLLHHLPSLRTIDFLSSSCLPRRTLIPNQVETIKFREVQDNELFELCLFLTMQSRHSTLPRALNRIEIYWRQLDLDCGQWGYPHGVAERTGVKMFVTGCDGLLHAIIG